MNCRTFACITRLFKNLEFKHTFININNCRWDSIIHDLFMQYFSLNPFFSPHITFPAPQHTQPWTTSRNLHFLRALNTLFFYSVWDRGCAILTELEYFLHTIHLKSEVVTQFVTSLVQQTFNDGKMHTAVKFLYKESWQQMQWNEAKIWKKRIGGGQKYSLLKEITLHYTKGPYNFSSINTISEIVTSYLCRKISTRWEVMKQLSEDSVFLLSFF
jgi:hypothetical protein